MTVLSKLAWQAAQATEELRTKGQAKPVALCQVAAVLPFSCLRSSSMVVAHHIAEGQLKSQMSLRASATTRQPLSHFAQVNLVDLSPLFCQQSEGKVCPRLSSTKHVEMCIVAPFPPVWLNWDPSPLFKTSLSSSREDGCSTQVAIREICFGLVVAALEALHEKDQQVEAVVAQARSPHFPASFGCRISCFVVSGACMFCLHSFFGCHVHISLLLEAVQFDRNTAGFMRCVFDSSGDCSACHVACKPPWSFVNLLSELVGQAHREMEELKQVLTASHVQAAN